MGMQARLREISAGFRVFVARSPMGLRPLKGKVINHELRFLILRRLYKPIS